MRQLLTRSTPPAKWPAYLSVPDLMLLFAISRRTVFRRMAAGDFGPWTYVGGHRYVPRNTLLEALEARMVYPALAPPSRPPRSLTARRTLRKGAGR